MTTKTRLAKHQTVNMFSQPKQELHNADSETEDESEPEAEAERNAAHLRFKRLLESAALAVTMVGMEEANKDADPSHVCVCKQKCGGRFCVCKSPACERHKSQVISAPSYENGVEGRVTEVLSEIDYIGMGGRPVHRLKKNTPKESSRYFEKKMYAMALKLWRRNGFPPSHSLALLAGEACKLENNIRRLVESSNAAIKQGSTPQACDCEVEPCAHAVRADFFPTLWPGASRSARDGQPSTTSSGGSAANDDE